MSYVLPEIRRLYRFGKRFYCTVATCCVMYNNLLTFTQLILSIKTVRNKVIYLGYSLLHAYVRICTYSSYLLSTLETAIKYLFTVYKDHTVVMLLVVPQSVTGYPT